MKAEKSTNRAVLLTALLSQLKAKKKFPVLPFRSNMILNYSHRITRLDHRRTLYR